MNKNVEVWLNERHGNTWTCNWTADVQGDAGWTIHHITITGKPRNLLILDYGPRDGFAVYQHTTA